MKIDKNYEGKLETLIIGSSSLIVLTKAIITEFRQEIFLPAPLFNVVILLNWFILDQGKSGN